MSLMCSKAACKAKLGMCTHEKTMAIVLVLLSVGFVAGKLVPHISTAIHNRRNRRSEAESRAAPLGILMLPYQRERVAKNLPMLWRVGGPQPLNAASQAKKRALDSLSFDSVGFDALCFCWS